MSVHTQTHSYVGFANPFLVCDECKAKVPYWHDPDRCSPYCASESFNYPCQHKVGVTSKCFTWNPVDGCECIDKENHDR